MSLTTNKIRDFSVISLLLLGSTDTYGDQVKLVYRGAVTAVFGTPYGITESNPGEEVVVSVFYDTSTVTIISSTATVARYSVNENSGFVFQFGDHTTVDTSIFDVVVSDLSFAFDNFTVTQVSGFSVNGTFAPISTQFGSRMDFTLGLTPDAFSSLDLPTAFDMSFVTGQNNVLADSTAGTGGNSERIHFALTEVEVTFVPEPTTCTLALAALCLVVGRRPR